jgi:hypothetical protein
VPHIISKDLGAIGSEFRVYAVSPLKRLEKYWTTRLVRARFKSRESRISHKTPSGVREAWLFIRRRRGSLRFLAEVWACKFQSPSVQAPMKHQIPSSNPNKPEIHRGGMNLGVRCLEILWCLDVGAWCFITSYVNFMRADADEIRINRDKPG